MSTIEVNIADVLKEIRDGQVRLENKIEQRFEKIEQRFEKIEQRFEKIEQRFERVDEKLDDLRERLTRVEEKVDALIPRVDHIETVAFRQVWALILVITTTMLGAIIRFGLFPGWKGLG